MKKQFSRGQAQSKLIITLLKHVTNKQIDQQILNSPAHSVWKALVIDFTYFLLILLIYCAADVHANFDDGNRRSRAFKYFKATGIAGILRMSVARTIPQIKIYSMQHLY